MLGTKDHSGLFNDWQTRPMSSNTSRNRRWWNRSPSIQSYRSSNVETSTRRWPYHRTTTLQSNIDVSSEHLFSKTHLAGDGIEDRPVIISNVDRNECRQFDVDCIIADGVYECMDDHHRPEQEKNNNSMLITIHTQQKIEGELFFWGRFPGKWSSGWFVFLSSWHHLFTTTNYIYHHLCCESLLSSPIITIIIENTTPIDLTMFESTLRHSTIVTQ